MSITLHKPEKDRDMNEDEQLFEQNLKLNQIRREVAGAARKLVDSGYLQQAQALAELEVLVDVEILETAAFNAMVAAYPFGGEP